MVNSFSKNLPVAEPVKNPNTRVITIATGYPGPAYEYLYRVVNKYGGAFAAVSDEATFRALHILAKMEGLSIEPAAATAFAGVLKLLEQGDIKKDETIVVNCSGHTFPVEKYLLDKDWLKVVSTSVKDSESSKQSAAPAVSQNLLGALDQLDERVKRIAIVEDNPDAARLLRRILQTQGEYQILEAHTGREGLNLIRTMHPDLVLLDLMMPDIDGFAVLDSLQADNLLENLPVIVITAKEISLDERNRLQGQIQILLQKGTFLDENLVNEINALLGQTPKDYS
jgi:threonine synthase